MGLFRSLSKSLSVTRRRGDDHDKDTASREEARSLLRRGETESALEVIERGLDEASARLLDENDETHDATLRREDTIARHVSRVRAPSDP